MEIVENTYYYYASEDLLDAQELLSTRRYRGSVISSAQAQEKFLKYLYNLETMDPIVKVMQTHSMAYLLRNMKVEVVANTRNEVIELGNMFFNIRYPTEDFIRVTEQDAVKALGIAEKVKEIVDERIAKRMQTTHEFS